MNLWLVLRAVRRSLLQLRRYQLNVKSCAGLVRSSRRPPLRLCGGRCLRCCCWVCVLDGGRHRQLRHRRPDSLPQLLRPPPGFPVERPALLARLAGALGRDRAEHVGRGREGRFADGRGLHGPGRRLGSESDVLHRRRFSPHVQLVVGRHLLPRGCLHLNLRSPLLLPLRRGRSNTPSLRRLLLLLLLRLIQLRLQRHRRPRPRSSARLWRVAPVIRSAGRGRRLGRQKGVGGHAVLVPFVVLIVDHNVLVGKIRHLRRPVVVLDANFLPARRYVGH
mmetsp:Transcript_9485/g.17833  ORF Transcript_9485/g.17833 Transcript_9485/m.17833 type:complete len:277 (-) Transcript_9485:272-1102(-)